jgi:hypothetical protein
MVFTEGGNALHEQTLVSMVEEIDDIVSTTQGFKILEWADSDSFFVDEPT